MYGSGNTWYHSTQLVPQPIPHPKVAQLLWRSHTSSAGSYIQSPILFSPFSFQIFGVISWLFLLPYGSYLCVVLCWTQLSHKIWKWNLFNDQIENFLWITEKHEGYILFGGNFKTVKSIIKKQLIEKSNVMEFFSEKITRNTNLRATRSFTLYQDKHTTQNIIQCQRKQPQERNLQYPRGSQRP